MPNVVKKVVAGLTPILVLAASIAAAAYLMSTAPQTERVTDVKRAPAVEVLEITVEPMARTVDALGTVSAAQEVSLAPEVDGRIVELHPALQPGGIVREGDVLVRIDPKEYELALARARAALAEAKAALEVEQGRQLVAKREWEQFGKDMPNAELGRELALREPQLHQAEAQIASAQSEVDHAQLDLDRTEIRAPFDAIVVDEAVDIGQHVRMGDPVASLVGTDAFWITASVPTSRLGAILDTAKNGETVVRVYGDVHADSRSYTEGRLVRHLGRVDSDGRMAQILVEVEDPLAIRADRLPLPLNSYVRVEIDAGEVAGAVPVPRAGLRENNEVWVADRDNRLQVRSADIVWRQDDRVAVTNVFEPGDQIILSPLEHMLPGMEVRPVSPSTSPSSGSDT